MAIANALQREAARRRASPYDTYAKFEVAQPVNWCLIAFLLLIRYINTL